MKKKKFEFTDEMEEDIVKSVIEKLRREQEERRQNYWRNL